MIRHQHRALGNPRLCLRHAGVTHRTFATRPKRTLLSDELKPIINNEDDLHLFVKKDDAEGNDFYYLGRVESGNQKNEKMPGADGDPLNVVTMDLSLLTSVEQGLYEYLTKDGSTQAPKV